MPAKSEAQRRAMFSAAEGKSTLGIPKAIGKEFVGKDGAPIAAGIVFVAPDGEVLLLRRASTEENYAGHWALPGGKADGDETAEDAATRECREEIGFDIDAKAPGLKLLDKVTTPNGMVFSTFAKPVEEKFVPKLNGEHSGYAWAGLDGLPGPLHPSVEKVLSTHIGVTADMTPVDWKGLRDGFAKWTREEEREPEHAQDHKIAMDRNLYDKRGRRVMSAERMAFDLKSVRSYDADGHLHVSRAPISKANICEYYGHEIPGAEELGLDPAHKYKLLRDPEELKKAAKSSNGKQLLIKHVPVNADDHQPDLTVGALGTDAEYEHPYLYNSLTVHAREGIDGIEDDTQKELSSAYRYRADMMPGTYEGAPYDGVMRDIDFNHVALVPEGRAGADVVVGDSKPNGEVLMTKAILTRKGTFLAGAVAAYLTPKLAQDSKFDVSAAFGGVTAANFKSRKGKIVDYITAKATLAQDANIDDLTELLDKLDGQKVVEGADIDPSSGLPMNAAEMKEKKAEDEDDDDTDKAARAEKIAAFKKAQGMDEESCKAFDELMGDLDGMDAEEMPVPVKKDEEKEKEPTVTKAAMDAAISKATAEATQKALQTANHISEAKEISSKWVGRLAMDAVSPADVYKAALDHLKIDLTDVHPSAFRKILEAQPVPGTARSEAIGMDAMPDTTGFAKRFGTLTDHIAIVG
jgi:8-oxo-dGTP pyrophosphatase MutT (NUDIX family)